MHAITIGRKTYIYPSILKIENGSDILDVVTDGLKHDGGKPRLSLVPAEAIIAIGTVMTHGAEKYGEKSYRQVDPKRHRDALMRHICKWLKDPQGMDEDSGMPHIWHIITNAAFLCELDISDVAKNKRTVKPLRDWSEDEKMNDSIRKETNGY